MDVKLKIIVIVSILSLVIIFLFSILSHELKESSPVTGIEILAKNDETDYSSLGLTEEELQELKERGVANVESAEVASQIAGFKVATPAYIPEGFRAGKFMIQLPGVGLPEELKPKFNNTQIDQYYSYPGKKNPMFLIIQSPHEFHIGGGEPAEICGYPCEKKYTEADPANGINENRFTLGWEKDGICYAINAVMGENFTETELEKVACSLITQ